MEETLRELGGILLNAVPTFILVILLHFYLKSIFFKPLAKVLQERYLATEGARKAARESEESAAAKEARCEADLRAARAEVYQAQEQVHRQLQQKEATGLAEARQRADQSVLEVKAQLARDVELAKQSLAGESDRLAEQIAEAMLRRSAA